MSSVKAFNPGAIVNARGREWVVLPESKKDALFLRPLGGGEEAPTLILPDLEPAPITHATFPAPNPKKIGLQSAGVLLRDALMMSLRAGAGPFRSFGNIAVEPRAYQLVPLMMALKQDTIRLLIADDVGIGKTIEAGLIAREVLDRGEIKQFTVLCPPHLCEQWQQELNHCFHIHAEIVRTATAERLERGLPAGSSIFTEYPFTVVSLDFIKNKNRRDAFVEQCPEFVVVDEAHTCSHSGQGRQLRFEVLKELSQDSDRHMLLLTATPHSGKDEAYYNLLSLLDEEFKQLQGVEDTKHPLRAKLNNHLIQRKRANIEEWQTDTFPEKLTTEVTYKLTGDWQTLFNDIMRYAKELVESEESGTFKERLKWWAALGLLRCISSSPGAAVSALNNRLVNALTAEEGIEPTEEEINAFLMGDGINAVYDGDEDNSLPMDAEPALATSQDATQIKALIAKAQTLKAGKDPKFKLLKKHLKELVKEGYNPVIFCRYIATAEYLAEELAKVTEFKPNKCEITCVTGQLSPNERKEKIEELKSSSLPLILVATDCLSEGINLQHQFNAVVHYDLNWNPSQHEQREGRVDRFGQQSKTVKTLMLYGEDNPIDGAVMNVVIKKADSIKKALGVNVPAPENEERYMMAILKQTLFQDSQQSAQMSLNLNAEEELEALEAKWQSATETAKKNRAIFAQESLKPDQVLPEWEKTVSALGSSQDVERFVTKALANLDAPLKKEKAGNFTLALEHLPVTLKERLDQSGLLALKQIVFDANAKAPGEAINRTHALVNHLADFLLESALEGENPRMIARSSVVKTKDPIIKKKTQIILLRLRNRLEITKTIDDEKHTHEMLAEEALAVKIEGSGAIELIDHDELNTLMGVKVSKDMPLEAKQREVQKAIEQVQAKQDELNTLAKERAKDVKEDHTRVRDAAKARKRQKATKTQRTTFTVKPQLPLDVLGVFVLMPDAALL